MRHTVEPLDDGNIEVAAHILADEQTALHQLMDGYRAMPPLFGTGRTQPRHKLVEHHLRVQAGGGTHLLANVQGDDVGLLTLEPGSPAPRLCRSGDPFIGPTSVSPTARGLGVGTALVSAAVEWSKAQARQAISVDFEPSNAASRPFWLGLGFRPTGYSMLRTISRPAPDPRSP